MTTVNVIELLAELPPEARPATLSHALRQDPAFWHKLRPATDPELQSLLGITPGALAERRRQGNGPPFHKIEGAVRYTLFECYEWLLRVQGIDPSDRMLDAGNRGSSSPRPRRS